ncbi:MAG: pyruvate kinase [Alphaproteobacteria bacterium]
MDAEFTEARDLALLLLPQISALQDKIAAESAAIMEGWTKTIHRPEFIPSATNMAKWMVLRHTDLSDLQAPLSALGLSTLGRLDGHVDVSIQAVLASLSCIAGQHMRAYPPRAAFDAGDMVLKARRDALFGDQEADDPRTRVMVTLPTEAGTDGGALIGDLVRAGMDCVRINCAHDSPEVWGAMIAAIRDLETASGRRIPISMDLGGPKFRVTGIEPGKKNGGSKRAFFPGDRFALVHDLKHAPKGLFTAVLSHAALADALVPGAEVSIDDGKIWAKVLSIKDGCAELEVTRAPQNGGKIKEEKGVNLPGSNLRVEALTADDLAALDFVVDHADVVSFSFVQTVDDVKALIAAMRERLTHKAVMPAIVLKIETPLGLGNLPDLIIAAGGTLPVGVMIARGDLAVEIGFDRLSEIQEEILWLCEAAQVPVIWATQVLEGMVRDGQASRAEVTDAAMSQRAECVMLNKGPHVVEAVSFLRGVLTRMDRHQTKKSPRLGPLHLWHGVARPAQG